MTRGQDLAGFWRLRFGAIPPLGYRLRAALAPRWVRVHSLPLAKRYATTEAEREEVRRRMRTAAAQVLGEGEAAWLIAAEWELTDGRLPELPHLALEQALTLADPEVSDGEPVVYRGARVAYRFAELAPLLDAVAGDARRALLVAVETGEVFAPYDGGADLIAADADRRARLAEDLAAWRSARPDGL